MKTKLFIALAMLLSISALNAQRVYDLKGYVVRREAYLRSEQGAEYPKILAGDYIQDQSKVLPPFKGTWVGFYQDYGYIFALDETITQEHNPDFKRDNLVLRAYVLNRSSNNSWKVEEFLNPHEEFQTQRTKGKIYYSTNSYSFFYKGKYPNKFGGLIMMCLTDSLKAKINLLDHPGLHYVEQEPQVFPVGKWSRKPNTNQEYAFLDKLSGDTALPHFSKTYDNDRVFSKLESLWQDLVLLGMLFQVDKTAYLPCFGLKQLNGMSLRLIPKPIDSCSLVLANSPAQPIIYDKDGRQLDYKPDPLEGKCIEKKKSDAENSIRILKGELELPQEKHSVSEDAFNLNEQAYPLNLKNCRIEGLTALLYRLATQRAMLIEIENSSKTFSDDISDTNQVDYQSLLRVYATKRGVTVEELKRHILDDADKLFCKASNFGNRSQLQKALTIMLKQP